MKLMAACFLVMAWLCSCEKPSELSPEKGGEITLKAHADPPDILCENKPYSDDDLDTAALEVLYPKMIHPDFLHPTHEGILRAKARLAEIRKWTDTIDNRRIKAAYIRWLDYYAKDFDDKDNVILKGEHKDPTEAEHAREQKEKQARAEALAKCLPIPLGDK